MECPIKSTSEKPSDPHRRDFLSLVIRFGLFATLAGLILPALSYLAPVTKRGPMGGMVDAAGADEIPLGSAKKVIVAGSAVIIIHTAQGFKSLSAVCTHLGCLVGFNQDRQQIVCPCHGGIYDADGKVISGPPPKPLPSHEVSVINGRIMVKV